LKNAANLRGKTTKLSIPESILAVALGAGLTAQADIIYNYSGPSYNIPDGDPAGVFSQITVSGALPSLSDITVTLNLSGGYNGDLYAYLSYNGALVPLLNRVGVGSSPSTTSAVGYSDSGFHLTLSDSGANGDIHLYQKVNNYSSLIANGTSTWTPDGRDSSPLSDPAQFDSASRLTLDNTFGGMDPNGTWTLFFADVSTGGGTSMLNGWSLNITAVPEPRTVALAVVGALAAVTKLILRRRLAHRMPHDAF
jgi:subtilisin-like proprotein convertase family protein